MERHYPVTINPDPWGINALHLVISYTRDSEHLINKTSDQRAQLRGLREVFSNNQTFENFLMIFLEHVRLANE